LWLQQWAQVHVVARRGPPPGQPCSVSGLQGRPRPGARVRRQRLRQWSYWASRGAYPQCGRDGGPEWSLLSKAGRSATVGIAVRPARLKLHSSHRASEVSSLRAVASASFVPRGAGYDPRLHLARRLVTLQGGDAPLVLALSWASGTVRVKVMADGPWTSED